MEKFNFFRDELGTIWYRDCFEVEAENYEEACKIAQQMVENDDVDNIDYSEPIWETWNPTSVSDNNGFSTTELQCVETNKVIWKNGE